MTTSRPLSTVTVKDAQRQSWLLDERVIGFRVVGTTIEKELPHPFDALTIGSAPECDLRFQNETVSRRHATVRYSNGTLLVEEATPRPKNGTFCEDEQRAVFQVAPGTWFAFGQLALVAYSSESKRVGEVFARHLGFAESAQLAIDRLYHAATRHRHIVLIAPPGAGMPLARALHEVTRGRREKRLPATIVPPTMHIAPSLKKATAAEQMAVLKRAARETLVIEEQHLPDDGRMFFDTIRARTYDVRLVLIVSPKKDAEGVLGPELRNESVAIAVPALADRTHEVARILKETIADQHSRLDADQSVLGADDVELLHRISWHENMAELEDCVARLVAVRLHRNNQRAAEALGFKSGGTISLWAKKYKIKLPR